MVQQLATAVLTLLADVSVLVVGFFVWKVLDQQGRFGEARERRSITEKAYILFLRTCRDMCLTLTAVSAVMLVPYFKLSDVKVELNLQIASSSPTDVRHYSGLCARLFNSTAVGGGSGEPAGGEPASCNLLCEELDLPMTDIFQCAMMCIMTVVNGAVALAFLQRFQRQVQMFDHQNECSPAPRHLRDSDAMERIGRTLWFTELPTADKQTGEPWLLDEEAFQRVEADIARELETFLHGAPAPTPRNSPIEEIRVAPEVCRLRAVALELRDAMDRGDAYAEWSRRTGGQKQWLSKYWYEHRSSVFKRRSGALRDELRDLVAGKKQMCGSAFVTFKSVGSARQFCSRKPDCCGRRSDLFFSFGHPPFASVTLRCMRAPHPSDLIWQNLQVQRRSQRGRLAAWFLLLLLVMLALVACLITAVEHEWWSDLPFVRESSQQIATLVLLFINSILLPELIYRMASAVREYRHSRAEVLQLHLNFIFLGINTLLIPLTGHSIIEIAKAYVQHTWWKATRESLLGCAWDQISQGSAFLTFRNMKWSFFLRYILNSACLSNTMSGLALHQIVYREWAKSQAVTKRDEVDAETPWAFPWGYWYAWSINILAIGLLLSMAVPLSLPCTALFFAIRHAVDQHNLRNNVYSSSFESEGTFVPRVLHYMRLIVATWWFFMGFVTLSGARRAYYNLSSDSRPELSVLPVMVTWVAVMLILLSSMMFIHSFWTLLESTHLLAWEGMKAVLEKEQAHIFDIPGQQDSGRSVHRVGVEEPGILGRCAAAIGRLLGDDDLFDDQQSDELVDQRGDDENGWHGGRLEWDARAVAWREAGIKSEMLPIELLPMKTVEENRSYF